MKGEILTSVDQILPKLPCIVSPYVSPVYLLSNKNFLVTTTLEKLTVWSNKNYEMKCLYSIPIPFINGEVNISRPHVTERLIVFITAGKLICVDFAYNVCSD